MTFNVLFISATVVLYGSLVNLLPHKILYEYKLYALINIIFLAFLWMLNKDLTLSSLGISSVNLFNSILLGLIIGSLTAITGILLMLFKGKDIKLSDPRIFFLQSPLMLVYGIFIHILIGTVLFEEAVHRGIVLARFQEITTPLYAVLLSSLVFAAWHIVSTIRLIFPTITSNIHTLYLQYFSFLGIIFLMFMGGIVFSWIRIYSGNIAGSVVAHGLINSITLIAFYILNKQKK